MKWNKKGAIELSITTIVVLIIAMAILGVAILLINMIREKAVTVLEDQFNQLEKDALSCIEGSRDVFCYKLMRDKLGIGDEIAMAVGVKNTAASQSSSGNVCFRMQLKCLRPFAAGEYCDSTNQRNDITVGGMDYNGDAPSTYWFVRGDTQGETDIKENEAKTLRAKLQINDAKPGSYEMEINIFKASNDKSCSDAEFDSNSIYASKGFNIEVD